MARKLRRVDWFVFGLALLFLAAACRADPVRCDDDPLGCAVIRPGNPIQIVTLLPMSGDTAVWGQELSRGINLALSSRGGEVLNHDIELIPVDSGCDTAVGLESIQNLDEAAPIVAIIGPACSQVAEAVLPTVRRNDWLLISPASTAPTLTQDPPDDAFFRTVPNHLHQATVAATFAIEELGMTEAAVLQDNSSFNSLLAQQFRETFVQLGGSIVYQGNLAQGQPDLDSLLTDTAASKPQLIYLALFEAEGNLVLNRMVENNDLTRTIVLGADALRTNHFAKQIGDLPTEIYVTGPALSGPAYDSFQAVWLNRYEALPTSPAPAYAYDATQLLLTAIEEVGVMAQNGVLVIRRGALRDWLATAEMPGLTGTLRCNPTGDCAASVYGVYELDTAVRNSAFWPPPLVWQYE